MANLIFLLLFAAIGPVRLATRPSNVSFLFPKPSWTPIQLVQPGHEPKSSPNNATRRANGQSAAQARTIHTFKDVLRCDTKEGFPARKQMLEQFHMLVHHARLYFFYAEFHIQITIPLLDRLFEDDLDEHYHRDYMLVHSFPVKIRRSDGNVTAANHFKIRSSKAPFELATNFSSA